MDLVQAAVLGIVQGATEFLPVSSSGHLVLVPFLLGWTVQSQAFDVALHLGTAISLLWFFRRDWFTLGAGFLWGLVTPSARHLDSSWRLALYVIVGSIPVGLSGLLLEDWFEREVRNPLVISVSMIGFGFVMLAVDRWSSRRRSIESIGWRDVAVIGISQALALIPGVSRSGITISSGLVCGLTREAAARFSFLLAGPPIVAAALWKLRYGIPPSELPAFTVGVVVSAVVGSLAIGFLLRYLQRSSLIVFVIERVTVGAAAILVAQTRGSSLL